MGSGSHRIFKNRLYGLFARIGKALANPHRLEMLELLAQGERTVDSLASEMGLSVANASQHLQALRQAALVDSRKERLFVHYRLAAPGAISVPVDELNGRLKQLPKGKEYVAYCRGPYCVYADRAVELLLAKGRRARRLKDGFPEWRAAGLPVAAGEAPGVLQ